MTCQEVCSLSLSLSQSPFLVIIIAIEHLCNEIFFEAYNFIYFGGGGLNK